MHLTMCTSQEEKRSVNNLRMEVAKLEIDYKGTKTQLDQVKALDDQKITRLEIDRDKEVLTIRETQDSELQRHQIERRSCTPHTVPYVFQRQYEHGTIANFENSSTMFFLFCVSQKAARNDSKPHHRIAQAPTGA
jgi:hypothetical protein